MLHSSEIDIGVAIELYDPEEDRSAHGTIVEVEDDIVIVRVRKTGSLFEVPVDALQRNENRSGLYVDWNFENACPDED